MSRSGYIDDYDAGDQWRQICWRGAVASAIRGKKGQALLREMLTALDAMPVKELIGHDLVREAPAFIPPEFAIPSVCALGAVGWRRGIELKALDPEDYSTVAKTFGVSEALVREIEYHNDGGEWEDWCPAGRWRYMRDWVLQNLRVVP